MANFAEISLNTNLVIRVIVVDDEDVRLNGGDCSIKMEELMKKRHPNSNTYWKQTSSNSLEVFFRKNYAGIGYSFDLQRDAFIPLKPFNSWVLNENTCRWETPIPYPTDGKEYDWDEEIINWREVDLS